jgi:hypothetical protein
MARQATPIRSVKPVAQAPATVKPVKAEGEYLAPAAMSPQAGYAILTALRDFRNTEKALEMEREKNQIKQYTALNTMTDAFIKAALADPDVRLEDTQSEDGKLATNIKQRLEVAIGLKIRKVLGDVPSFEYAPYWAEFFNAPGETKDKANDKGLWQAKDTFRSNFAHLFKKAAQAAHGIVATKMQHRIGSDGLMYISGPKVLEHFKADEVPLNEKQEIIDDQGRTVKLAKKPSFTELTRISAVAAKRELPTNRVDSRLRGGGAASEETITAAVRDMINALKKLKTCGKALYDALSDLAEQIDETSKLKAE